MTHILHEQSCYLISPSLSNWVDAPFPIIPDASFDIILVNISRVSHSDIYFQHKNIFKKYNRQTHQLEACQPKVNEKRRIFKYVAFAKRPRTNHHTMFQLQIIKCKDGKFVSSKLFYTGKADCDLKHPKLSFENVTNTCVHHNRNVRRAETCPSLHYLSSEGCCLAFSTPCGTLGQQCEIHASLPEPQTNIIFTTSTEGSVSPTVNKSSPRQLNLFTDCQEEEINATLIGTNVFVKDCMERDKIQCTYGCKKCFPPNKICVFELDKNNELMHCPSGGHLKHCEGMECNNMFKCHKSYCVPHR